MKFILLTAWIAMMADIHSCIPMLEPIDEFYHDQYGGYTSVAQMNSYMRYRCFLPNVTCDKRKRVNITLEDALLDTGRGPLYMTTSCDGILRFYYNETTIPMRNIICFYNRQASTPIKIYYKICRNKDLCDVVKVGSKPDYYMLSLQATSYKSHTCVPADEAACLKRTNRRICPSGSNTHCLSLFRSRNETLAEYEGSCEHTGNNTAHIVLYNKRIYYSRTAHIRRDNPIIYVVCPKDSISFGAPMLCQLNNTNGSVVLETPAKQRCNGNVPFDFRKYISNDPEPLKFECVIQTNLARIRLLAYLLLFDIDITQTTVSDGADGIRTTCRAVSPDYVHVNVSNTWWTNKKNINVSDSHDLLAPDRSDSYTCHIQAIACAAGALFNHSAAKEFKLGQNSSDQPSTPAYAMLIYIGAGASGAVLGLVVIFLAYWRYRSKQVRKRGWWSFREIRQKRRQMSASHRRLFAGRNTCDWLMQSLRSGTDVFQSAAELRNTCRFLVGLNSTSMLDMVQPFNIRGQQWDDVLGPANLLTVAGCSMPNVQLRKDTQLLLKNGRPERQQRKLHMTVMVDLFLKTVLISQPPTKDHVAEHWEAVWQENVGVIVSIGAFEDKGKNKSLRYFGIKRNEKMESGNYSVETTDVTRGRQGVDYYKVLLHVKSLKESRKLYILHVHFWPNAKMSKRIRVLSDAVMYAQCFQIQQERAELPSMLIHCPTGIHQSCTFMSIYVGRQVWLRFGKLNVISVMEHVRRYRYRAWTLATHQIFAEMLLAHYVLYNVLVETESMVKRSTSKSSRKAAGQNSSGSSGSNQSESSKNSCPTKKSTSKQNSQLPSQDEHVSGDNSQMSQPNSV